VTYPNISYYFFPRDTTEAIAALDPNLKKFAEYQSNLLLNSRAPLDEQVQDGELPVTSGGTGYLDLLRNHSSKLKNALSQTTLSAEASIMVEKLKENISPFEASPCSYQDVIIPINCSTGSLSSKYKTVALIGDSKMGHFAQPLIDYFASKNWRIEPMIMDGCILSDPKLSQMKNCVARSQWVLDKVASSNYDLVISAEWPGAKDLKYKNDFFRSVQQNSKYLVILQTNSKTQSPRDCISSKNTYSLDCQKVPEDLVEGWRGALSFMETLKSSNTSIINAQEWICVDTICPYAFDDVLVTRDGSHLTYTFVRAITNLIFASLDEIRTWEKF
jgi:hypothetical protein